MLLDKLQVDKTQRVLQASRLTLKHGPDFSLVIDQVWVSHVFFRKLCSYQTV